MATVSQADLDILRALRDQASPGPWERSHAYAVNSPAGTVANMYGGPDAQRRADAELVVTLRCLLDQLLDGEE